MHKKIFVLTMLILLSVEAHSSGIARLFSGGREMSMDDGGETVYEGGMGGDCMAVPPSVKEAYQVAQKFSHTCSAAQLSSGKKIVVNDYSGQGRETMYVFDQRGNCVDSMYISYGSGAGSTTGRVSSSCAKGGSGKTPAGMHLTGPHNGGTYNSSNSLKLAGLSGQGSAERQILIHASKWGLPAAVSQGCTGVPKDKLYKVMQSLGYGSLVYNYFGNEGGAKGCSNNSGSEKPPSCEPEPYARQIARTSNHVSLAAEPSQYRERKVESGSSSSGQERGQKGAN